MLAAAATALVGLAACSNETADKTGSPAAQEASGDNTISDGFGDATTFQKAVKSTGLDGTLAGPGPYTVLIPTNAAFDKLPAGALDTLMKDDARQELTGVLTYHILPGTILAEDIGKAIDAGKGKTNLPTMGGGTITATRDGDAVVLEDGAGTKARLVGTDEKRSNGVIHRLDAVLMPS
ncbi:fasciclin domain-containing protein [Sphingomonas jaspsi]|uniref:fasciclin domain-containing protein n=1 Tax=Sphingomonas jaspsi TaxID=392409 RepID=UPI0004B426E3|nr:fasciclin domain-containing protein [Sphingomonas jaspsi]